MNTGNSQKPSVLSVHCPVCGKPVKWVPEEKWRPFCSARCRLIDLGDWAGEAHRIPGEPAPGEGSGNPGEQER